MYRLQTEYQQMEKRMDIIQLAESDNGFMNTEQRSCFFKRAITGGALSFCIKVYLANKWETWVEISFRVKKNQRHSCFPEERIPGKSLEWDTFAYNPPNEKHGTVPFIYIFQSIFQMLLPDGTAFECS